MPVIPTRMRRAWRSFRDRPRSRHWARSLAHLERAGSLTAGEAHALRAGEQLADLYAEIAEGEEGVSLDQLEDIERLIRVGDLSEAVIQLGRLHPALRNFPALYHRRAGRARA